MSFAKVRSWHVVLTITRTGSALTRCGRLIPQPRIQDALPLDEKSCESCLRLVAHDGPDR